MRYAVINTDNTLVYSAHEYTGTAWSLFKTTYELEHTDRLLVDLGSSIFPAWQGWSQETDGTYPVTPSSMVGVAENIIKAVSFRTDEIQYSGVVTFGGGTFSRDHDTRDNVALLALSCSTNAEAAASLLPLKVNDLYGNEVVIATPAEAEALALAMLSPTKSVYDGQAAQIAAVKAMTTITQLITYVDPR